jgi:hypothetical protein
MYILREILLLTRSAATRGIRYIGVVLRSPSVERVEVNAGITIARV